MIQNLKQFAFAGCILAATGLAASAQPRPDMAPIGAGSQNLLVEVQARKKARRKLRRMMRRQGYDSIRIKGDSAPYQVRACKSDALMSMQIGKNDEIKNTQRIGLCGRSARLGPQSDTMKSLDRDGYRKVEVVFEDDRRTVLTGCKGGKQIRILVNRRGKIRNQKELGECGVRRKRRGNRRVDVRDNRPRDKQIDSRNNRPRNQQAGGRAILSDNPVAVREFLSKRRYRNIKLVERNDRIMIVEACRRIRKFNIRINRENGRIVKRKRIGWCERQRGGVRLARAPKPRIDFEGSSKIDGEKCQDALEYLLDSEKVYFETASAEIGRKSLPLLNKVSRIANRCPSSRLEIAGHTDSVGSDQSNQRLSEDRARSVVSYLRDKGVSRQRVSAVGYGESRPVADNNSLDGRALNRRIEIQADWEE